MPATSCRLSSLPRRSASRTRNETIAVLHPPLPPRGRHFAMSTVIAAPAPITVPVAGTGDTFPVRHVYCVGRNYAEHTKEMGGDTKEPPFFFTKFADAIVPV